MNEINNLYDRYPQLNGIRDSIEAAYTILADTYRSGGKLFVCGNGGSCSDGEHIVGELMKNFRVKRKIRSDVSAKLAEFGEIGETLKSKLEGALPAISLNGHNSLSSAFINDTDPLLVYAQQLYGLGNAGDSLITITTSGNSRNCLYAAAAAKAMGIKVVALTGVFGGKISGIADVTVKAPEKETYLVQELHLPIYHWLCETLEREFFTEVE